MHDLNEMQILLVEDNPNDAELTLRALKKHHLANRVHHVKDGAEALDFMFGTGMYAGRSAAAGPRVVMLDLKLPKVDGWEVLRRIKADERTKDTPVVILTSSREESDLVEGYRLGVNSYVVKPPTQQKLEDLTKAIGECWLREKVSLFTAR